MLIEIKDIMEDDYRNLDQSKIATSTLQHRHDFRYDANGNVIYETTARKHNNVFEDKTFGNSLLEKLEFHGMNLVIIFCIFYKIQNQTVPLCIIQNFFLITNVMKEAEVGAIPQQNRGSRKVASVFYVCPKGRMMPVSYQVMLVKDIALVCYLTTNFFPAEM